jgi:TP901 family phage tail tape measure protein
MAFDADFGAGEDAARALRRRMEEKLRAAEEAAKQAEADKRFNRRVRETARSETDAERNAPRGKDAASTEEGVTRRRITDQRQLNQLAKERTQLEVRQRGEIERTAQVEKRYAQEQRALVGPGGGGGGGRRPPPRFFAQPPEEPPRGPAGLLPSGRPPYRQIAQVSEPHPEYPGQVLEERNQRMAQEATAARRQATGATKEGIGPTERLTASVGREAGIQASANREFQRFGALSSEWIGAAGRGATTMEELGRQTSATIGKFGGWLAAGALVFTALDGVRAIGKGAIESASGVNQLQRVIKSKGSIDPDTLEKSFRGLSQHYNLPIEQVTQAAYEMGKVFHTQNEALEASKAVLYSVKVGELDTATASRYLIAIINGFHLPATQLTGIFDQLNNAQNEFGISISDVEAGLAKASGSFNAATTKGSALDKYHELLALITTAQKATGQTGQVVGTAIQRAPNFLRQAKNKNILKKYGIDSGGDLNDIIVQAFEKAQSLSGHKIGELASAIFGPQYGARIGTPLFQQFDLYKKVLAKTGPGPSKGSGEEELQTQLGSVQEKIKQIGVELESVGSNLAEAGFFDALGVGLETLNLILSDANQLLEIFNSLPDPIKQSLVYFLEIKAVLGVLRKFNVGDQFAPESLGRKVFSRPNRDARLYDEQLLGVQKAGREELSGVNNSTKREARTVLTNQAKADAAAAERAALAREGHAAGSPVLLAADKEVNATTAALRSSEARYADLQAQRLTILTELRNTEATAAALQAEMTDANARQLAGKNQEVIQNSFNKGVNTSDAYAAQLGYGFRKDESGQFVPYNLPGGPPTEEARAAAQAAEGGVVQGSRYSRATSKLSGALGKTKLVLTDATAASTAMKRGLTGIESAASGLYSSLGGITGIGFAAMLAIPLLQGPIEDLAKGLAGGQGDIDNAEHLFDPKNSKRSRQLQDLYKNFSDNQLKALGRNFIAEGAPSWYNAERARLQRQEQENQRVQAERGEAQRGLFPDQLAGRLRNFTQLNPNSKGYTAAKKKLEAEINSGASQYEPKEYDQVKKHFDAVVSKNINKQASFIAFLNTYNATSDKLLEAYSKNLASIISGGPAYASPQDLRSYIKSTEVRGLRDLGTGKKGLEAKGIQALTELPQTLEAYGQEELKLSQTLARTDKAREAAFGPYIQSLQQGLAVIRSTLGKGGKETRAELEKTERRLKVLRSQGKQFGFDLPSFGGDIHIGATKADEAQYDKLVEHAKDLRRQAKNISKAQRHQERQLRAAIQEQRDAQTEEHIATLGEVGQIASARIGGEDPVAQAQATLGYAQKALTYARKRNASQKTIRQALLAVLQAREQLEESVKSEAEDLAGANEALAVGTQVPGSPRQHRTRGARAPGCGNRKPGEKSCDQNP